MQWEQKLVNCGLKYIKIGKHSSERENSKASQCMENRWFGRRVDLTLKCQWGTRDDISWEHLQL